MKTTIELPDGLLREAKRTARREGTTLRALLEQGLRRSLDDRRRAADFRLRDGSVAGNGLNPELDAASWETIRDHAYKGRGA